MDRFEFTNIQRPYFGLNTVQDHWERIEFPKGLICYFDGNVIQKTIQYSVYNTEYYTEFDTLIGTNQRTHILSKTGKGKEKPITPTNIYETPLKTSYFHVEIKTVPNNQLTIYTKWTIGKQELDFKNNAIVFHNLVTLHDFQRQITPFIAQLPEYHLETIQTLKATKTEKTKPVRFQSGDFFAIPIAFDLYGKPTLYNFGRHLINVAELRKKGLVEEDHQWNSLMTVVQLVMLYSYTAPTLEVDLTALAQAQTIPSFHMMDDNLMRGIYPIVGHLPLKAEELNFPLHFFHSATDYSLGWGLARIEKQGKHNIDPVPDWMFRNNIVSSGAAKRNLDVSLIYEGEGRGDLQHPKHKATKEAIFKAFNIDPNLSYDDFCVIAGCKNRQGLLDLIEKNKKNKVWDLS
ncbi:Imm26 family immunity protein [Flavobacterium sp. '19STA2R22 D10 B1']|uniref:Imm26 family immunity protein n=1 Tax=Flavobacterium aerium TaxID=3037261 RepID=UPI00278C6FB4|nr:Imm26 family immunity protein [Flavobacterium sp. '19STA2R22 D10 B1']